MEEIKCVILKIIQIFILNHVHEFFGAPIFILIDFDFSTQNNNEKKLKKNEYMVTKYFVWKFR